MKILTSFILFSQLFLVTNIFARSSADKFDHINNLPSDQVIDASFKKSKEEWNAKKDSLRRGDVFFDYNEFSDLYERSFKIWEQIMKRMQKKKIKSYQVYFSKNGLHSQEIKTQLIEFKEDIIIFLNTSQLIRMDHKSYSNPFAMKVLPPLNPLFNQVLLSILFSKKIYAVADISIKTSYFTKKREMQKAAQKILIPTYITDNVLRNLTKFFAYQRVLGHESIISALYPSTLWLWYGTLYEHTYHFRVFPRTLCPWLLHMSGRVEFAKDHGLTKVIYTEARPVLDARALMKQFF